MTTSAGKRVSKECVKFDRMKAYLVACHQLEGDILSYGRGSPIRARFVALLLSELGPLLSLGNSMIYDRLLQRPLDFSSDLSSTPASE